MPGDAMNSKMARRLLAAAICLATALPAQAELSIVLQRLSDTGALMQVRGEIDAAPPGSNAHALALVDPFTIRPADNDSSWVLDESNLSAGDFLFNFANQAGRCVGGCPGTQTSPGVLLDNSGRANTIYFGNNDVVFPFPFPFRDIPSNTPFVGTMLFELQHGASFAPVGASGEVLWGATAIGLGRGVLVGSWQMVSAPVPEPGAQAMLLLGLGLLGLQSLRRRSASNDRPRSSHWGGQRAPAGNTKLASLARGGLLRW